MSESEKLSPLDHLFPDVLTCHVVEVGETPRIHGFEALGDLGENFSAAERLLISLTGEEPLEGAAEILERLLVAFSPRGIDEAPAHAGTVTRLFSNSEESVMSNVLLALSAQAEAIAKFIFDDGQIAIDLSVAATWFSMSEEESREPRAVFRNAFLSCGLKERWQVATVWVQAALPSVIAESMSAKYLDFENYPMNLPPVELDQ